VKLSAPIKGCLFLAVLGAWLFVPAAARGYIDQAPDKFTLPKLLLEFRSAGLYVVERVNLEQGVIRYKPLEPIQGLAPSESITHTIAVGTQVPPELKRVAVGQKAVLFRDDPYARAVTMIEGTWYLSSWDRSANCARFGGLANPYFECGFCGSVGELVRACKALVRGEEITVRCRPNPKTTQTQWVTTSLREPHKRKVVAGPASAPAAETQPAPAVEVKADGLAGLLERLKAEKPVDRMEAAGAIGRLGPAARPAVAVLTAAFPQEKDPFARRAMIMALGAIGPEARPAVPTLLAAIRDGYGSVDDLVGFEASAALAKVDPNYAATTTLVVAMIKDANPGSRGQAAGLVRLLGIKGEPMMSALLAATRDPTAGVRREALRSIMFLKPDPATVVPPLVAGLEEPDKYWREYVATALAGLGPDARPAIKPLMAAIAKETVPAIKAQQIRALRYIGPAAAEALPMLADLQKDPNGVVRMQADKAIKKIRPDGK
jgi:HEAT repeat protein